MNLGTSQQKAWRNSKCKDGAAEGRKGPVAGGLEGKRSEQSQKECRLCSCETGHPLAVLKADHHDCTSAEVWLLTEGQEYSKNWWRSTD